jgi:hypothetical protein
MFESELPKLFSNNFLSLFSLFAAYKEPPAFPVLFGTAKVVLFSVPPKLFAPRNGQSGLVERTGRSY